MHTKVSRFRCDEVSPGEVIRTLAAKAVSVADVAKQFGVTPNTAADWCWKGVKLGHNASRVSRDAWNEFAATGRTAYREPQAVTVGATTARAVATRTARLSITLPKGALPLHAFASVPVAELARMCGVTPRTAKDWCRAGKAPAHIVTLLNLFHFGPLGVISPAWAEWSIRDGKLFNSDGHEYTPTEVWLLPILHQRVAALEASNRALEKALSTAIEAAEHSRTLRRAGSIDGRRSRPNLPARVRA